MDPIRQLAVFLIACSLASTCICASPPRSHRQKRGLMKMMMHIMWDPVRLIRYWHVYDVTKEIAKSWRKILPTIMLLPVTNNNPHSYSGIAKYVHPTNGFTGSKKYKLKHLSMPHEHQYLKSAGGVQSVATPPKSTHPAMFSNYIHASDLAHSGSSQEAIGPGLQNYNSLPPVVVGHVPYGDDQHTVAHYYMKGFQEHRVSPYDRNFISIAHHQSNNHDDIRSSSSQHVLKENIHGYVPSSGNHIHYVPHMESDEPSVHDDSEKRSLVLQPGQEFRVVLHPIPVRDFDALKPPQGGPAIQFVQVNSQAEEFYDSNTPVLFKAMSGAGMAEDGHHAAFHDETDSEEIDRSENSEERKSASSERKNSVTWVAKKSPSRRTNLDEKDLSSDGSVRRILSVQKFSEMGDKSKTNSSVESRSKVRKTFGLHRYNINLDQLREDLKHGTPVLIPFSKNTQVTDSSVGVTEMAGQPTTTTASNEDPGKSSDSQRLLLFLKNNS